MTISDPIADMLTRIRNVAMAGQSLVVMPNSKLKSELARILQEEGYLESFEIVDGKVEGTKELRLKLKYIGERRHRRPIITGLTRVSRPGCRVYTSKEEIPWVLSGIGIAIISTPKGIMTGQRARKIGVGGEILCKVWEEEQKCRESEECPSPCPRVWRSRLRETRSPSAAPKAA